ELAARRATAADVEACAQALQRLAAAPETPQASLIADVDFHQAVAQASGNRMLVLLLEGLREPLRVARTRSWQGRLRVGHEIADQIDMHRRILVAVGRRQPRVAAEAMARHLDLAEVHLRAGEVDVSPPA